MIGDIFQPTHLLFLLVIVLLVLGPKRLPEMARSLGRGFRDFRDAISGEDHSAVHELQQDPIPPTPPETVAPIQPDAGVYSQAHAPVPAAAEPIPAPQPAPAADHLASPAADPATSPAADRATSPAHAPMTAAEPDSATSPAPEPVASQASNSPAQGNG